MAGGAADAGKPRPVVIVQDDALDATVSLAVCPMTSAPVEAPIRRAVDLGLEGRGSPIG